MVESNHKRVHLYCKNFNWELVDPSFKMLVNGHPRTGMVYRGLHNTATNTYLVFTDKGSHPLIFDKLVSDTGDVEMVVLDKKNFIEITPKEEFLDEMLRWFAEDEARTIKLVENKTVSKEKKIVENAIVEIADDEIEAIKDWGKVMSQIFTTNRELFYELKDICNIIHQCDMNCRPSRMKLQLSQDGRGINALDIQEYLEDYLETDDSGDITGVVVSGVFELLRRRILKLDTTENDIGYSGEDV